MRANVVDDLVAKHIPADAYPEAWDIAGLERSDAAKLNLDLPVADWAKEEGIADEEMRERLHKAADEAYAERVEKNTPDLMRYVEKQVVLQVARPSLARASRHARSSAAGDRLARHAQRDPLNEYKSEAFELFKALIARWHEVIAQMMRIEVASSRREPELPPMQFQHLDPLNGEDRSRSPRSMARSPPANSRPRRSAWSRRRRCRAPRARPEKSGDLGQGRPQRGLPLRVRQEIQALPRRVRLTVARALQAGVTRERGAESVAGHARPTPGSTASPPTRACCSARPPA